MTTVHLVRHGQTASYDLDDGLTDLGRQQSLARGRALAAQIPAGAPVDVVHAPTRRTRDTAAHIAEVLTAEQPGRTLTGPAVETGFRNPQVLVDGAERDPTQARALLDRPGNPGAGWAFEARAFWVAHEQEGDAMAFWLRTPLLWHDSPAQVVARTMATVRRHASAPGAGGRHVVVGTHSGVLRALLTWARGADPGEPENCAVVTVRPDVDRGTADIGYADLSSTVPLP